ncbi:MAG: DNA-directed RNA polymerase subunit N [Thermoprotei archaeon]
MTRLLFPVRCFTCGAVIGDKWEDYEKAIKEGRDPAKVLDELGVKRYCCRRMFLTYYDLADQILEYSRKGEP